MKHLLNLYDILEALEKRKAMYLGNDYTFHSLYNFVTGFIMAAQDVQLEKPDIPNFTYFSTWIIGHLDQHYGLSGGWHWQILNRNLNDDQKAFQEFFYFLDIFKNSKFTCKHLLVDQHSTKSGVNGPTKRIAETSKIRWIQLSNSTTVWIEILDKSDNIIADSWHINSTEANHYLDEVYGSK